MKENAVVKSTIWYMICNFIVAGINFIVTPIFTRLMSQEDYGLYSNFTSWITILQIISSLMLLSSFYSAKYDFKEKINEYISSMIYLGGFFCILLIAGVYIFRDSFVAFTKIDAQYLPILCLSLLFYPATGFFQLEQRLDYKYKESVFISLVTVICTVAGALILVLTMDNKLWGRIYGSKVAGVVINFFIVIYFIKRAPAIRTQYWGYALRISVPFVVHSLGMTVLSSSDRIMITSLCGAKDNSLYSLAYSCAAVMNMFISALSAAIDPWLLESYQAKDDSCKKKMGLISALVMFGCIGAMLLAPEILLVMGGEKYLPAISVMPPIIMGTFFQFLYGIYANVEQFAKKTSGMAIATGIAAVANLGLNYIFIPMVGYKAAGYTTLFCYVLLAIIHVGIVNHIGGGFLFRTKLNLGMGIFGILLVLLIEVTYAKEMIRVSLIGIYVLVVIYVAIRYRKAIMDYLKMILRKN